MQRNWAIILLKNNSIVEMTDENTMPAIKHGAELQAKVEKAYVITQSDIDRPDFQERFKKLQNWEEEFND